MRLLCWNSARGSPVAGADDAKQNRTCDNEGTELTKGDGKTAHDLHQVIALIAKQEPDLPVDYFSGSK